MTENSSGDWNVVLITGQNVLSQKEKTEKTGAQLILEDHQGVFEKTTAEGRTVLFTNKIIPDSKGQGASQWLAIYEDMAPDGVRPILYKVLIPAQNNPSLGMIIDPLVKNIIGKDYKPGKGEKISLGEKLDFEVIMEDLSSVDVVGEVMADLKKISGSVSS